MKTRRRVRVEIKWTVAVMLAIAQLGGCAKNPPIYPDFCKAEGKAYSDREKIVATLNYIVEKSNRLDHEIVRDYG